MMMTLCGEGQPACQTGNEVEWEAFHGKSKAGGEVDSACQWCCGE